MKKIGILGGTFDPVHFGHLGLATDAAKQANLDEVWLVPAKLSPFKLNSNVSSNEDRLAMLEAGLAEWQEKLSGTDAETAAGRLGISRIEMNMEGVSYTYLTLREVRKSLGKEDELFFITGADTFVTLEKWRNSKELLSENAFIVGHRPGYEDAKLCQQRDLLYTRYGTKTLLIENTPVNVSSTEIRERMDSGDSLEDILPNSVACYIREHGLYHKMTLKEKVLAWNEEHLSEKRKNHTEGVRTTALHLAKIHGVDLEKAELCALMHDMYRIHDQEMLDAMIDRLGVPQKYKGNLKLGHSKIAAAALEQDWGVKDTDLLNAVSYHTTGRPAMSPLEMVVYLADATEPARDYPGLAELRALSEKNLEEACLWSLDSTLRFVQSQLPEGAEIDKDTVRARDYLQTKLSEAGRL